MAYCVFTNCLSILGSGITPYTSLDSRSGVSLTSNGQMMFVGSSDNSGPLGLVFQHINSFGVCRVDITSTRYGISGNDLSLNVDSSDPDIAGGLYIKYRGNVGIGTSSPSTKLNIRNKVDRAYTPNSYNDTLHALHIDFCNQNQRAGLIRFTSHGNLENSFGVVQVGCAAAGCGQGDFVFQAYREAGGAAYNELMRLTNGGRVGIGTSCPSTLLQVCGNVSGENAAWVQNTNSLGYGSLRALNNLNCAAVFGVGGSAVGAPYANTGYLYTDSNVNFIFSIGASEKMKITSGGNVGIGICNPIDKLEVAGGIHTSGTAAFSKACSGYLDYYLGQVRLGITGVNPSTPAIFRIDQYSCNNSIQRTPFYIDASGNTGINTVTPCTKLQVAGGLKSSGTTELVWIGTCDATQPLVLTFKAIGGATSADRGMSIISTEAGLGGNFLDINETSTRTRFFSDGNVNIGSCAATSYRLNVNGAFYAAGSSKEYKTSICEYNTDSCMFMKLKPVTYDYKEEWKHLGKQLKSGTQIGLIAEDTAEVFPELAVLKEEENEQVVRNVDYEKLSIILLSEVQKLRKEIDDLKYKQ